MAGNSRTLTIKILSDASGVAKGFGVVDAQLTKFSNAFPKASGGVGTDVGNALVGGIDKALGVGLKVVGGAGAAVLGTALFKGFNRLTDIDNATASLKGLGYSTQDVAKIMGNARAAVDDTKYALGDMAGVAGTMVAAGVQPGQQLTSVLKGIADSAFIGKTSIDDMGQIWGKVAAKNKVSGQEINQLLERQIPILTWLGDAYGVTAEQASQMVSRGEIDFQTFAAVMEENLGGAALESGNTMQGAWDNAMAALGRIGAALLEPMFGPMTDGVNGLKDTLKSLEPVAASVGQSIANVGKWVGQNIGLFKTLGAIAATVVAGLLIFRTVVGIFQAYNAVMGVVKAAMLGYKALQAGLTIGTAALTGATTAQKIAATAGAVAQWALNSAFLASPITWIIVGIVALVAAFILLWTKCEGFRNFFIGLWEGIKTVVAAVVDWFVSAWNAVVSWLTAVWSSYVAGWQAIWAGVTAVVQAVVAWFQGVWSGIVAWFTGVWNAYVAIWTAIWSGIQAAVSVVVSWFQSAWNAVASWFGSIWKAQQAVVGAVFSAIQSVVNGVVSWFASAWNGAVSAVSGVIRTLQGVFQSVFSAIMAPINAVIGAFQTVVGWIKQVISWLSQIKIPDVFGAIGGLFGARSLEVAGSYSMQPVSPLASRSGMLTGLPALRALPSLRTLTAGGMGDIISINVEGGLDSADTIARRVKQALENRDRRSRGVSVAMRTA